MKLRKVVALITVGILILSLGGCTGYQTNSTDVIAYEQAVEITSTNQISTIDESSNMNSLLTIEDMFSDRDLEQEADLTEATTLTLEDDQTITIDQEGIYVITGEATNASIVVDVPEDAKVQLVLDGVHITNDSMPAIYVKTSDKVFVTTTDTTNVLEVTGNFTKDGDTNLDAAIFSKSDLVLNGIGTLEVTSKKGNGITSKDDLLVTGGTYIIESEEDSLEANDSIRIYDGDFTIETGKDGLHSENEDDLSLGYIYIAGGTFTITALDDAIHGTSVVQIDGGTIQIVICVEGIEGNYILINQGSIDIYATDDGINATASSEYDVVIEVNGGDINIEMADGDTDGFDSNGDIYINGGNIEVDAMSSFDASGNAVLSGGTVIVNGETLSELPVSQMPGGGGRRLK